MKLFKIAAVTMACFLVLAGCAKSEFGMRVDENGAVQIHAENAKNGDKAGAGTFTVKENQELVMESSIKDGDRIKISFVDTSDSQNADADVSELTNEEADWVYFAEGSMISYGGIKQGDYFVNAEVDGKATGDVKIYTRDIVDPDPWTKAADKAEALSAVGIESFEIPEGAEIGLGPITAGEFRTHEGAVKVNAAFPAVDMFIFKAPEEVNGGDPSYVTEEYANEWTQDIEGITVTCWGNHEGHATKTVWTRDGYSYAVVVYGLGGDTDFGLSADDLAIIVPNVY